MDEAEQLCDRLVIMDKARIVAEGSPRRLIDEHATREVLELRPAAAARDGLDARLAGLAERIDHLQDRVLLYTDDGERLLEEVRRRGVVLESALVRRASLEDVFLHLTGRSLVD
jgi:lipooligosaccharide transport system ATP-binding protein